MLVAIAAKLDAKQQKIEDLHDKLMGFKSMHEASMDAMAEIIGDYLGVNTLGEVRTTSTATCGTQTVEPSQSDGETSSPSWRDVLLRPCSVPVHATPRHATVGTPPVRQVPRRDAILTVKSCMGSIDSFYGNTDKKAGVADASQHYFQHVVRSRALEA